MNLSKYLTKTNLGVLMVVAIVLYIIMICFRHQNKMIEQFTNDTATGTSLGNLDDNIMTCCDDLKDKLNYGSHKQKIDDLLVALHEHHNYNMMGHYVDYAKYVSNKDMKSADDTLDHIIKLNTSRDCLHKVQNFIEQSN